MRLGIDLVRVKAIEGSVRRFGERFLRRVYTPGELADCGERDILALSQGIQRAQVVRLAARFAAKEAVMKILRPADVALPWQSIEVRSELSGVCRVELHREAHALAAAIGIHSIEISLTHEQDYAAAIAVGRISR